MYATSITDLIGHTPLLRLNSISERSGALVLGKCEFMNPTGSVKDRIGHTMIHTAMSQGLVTKDTVVVEPTSGNTGIALASICAALGLRLILTMPSSMSVERQKLLRALGAELELTQAEKGMRGAVERAHELLTTLPQAFMPMQFENRANPAAHEQTTAQEIWDALNGKIDIFIAAVGTGGTVTGIGRFLKKKNPDIKVIAVEPVNSPVLSGGQPGPHKIQGIGAGFVPSILEKELLDEVLGVAYEDAVSASRKIAKEEGVLVGISAGANIYAAQTVANRQNSCDKTIVTVLCDTGERYLSTELYS